MISVLAPTQAAVSGLSVAPVRAISAVFPLLWPLCCRSTALACAFLGYEVFIGGCVPGWAGPLAAPAAVFGSKDGCGAGPCCPRDPAAGALPLEGPAAGPGLQLVLAEECSCPALSTLWRGLCSASMSLTFSVLCDSIGCRAARCLMSLWGLGGNGQPIKIWNIEKVRAIWWGHSNSQNFSGVASLAASPCVRA